MEANGLKPEDKVPATKKLGRADAERLAKGSSRLIVAKGKKVAEFEVGEQTSAAAIDAMLGPTGNLRAPTVRAGTTLVVGFNEEHYSEVFL